ncbi:MAG: hypothetical protein ABF719_09680, partial [Acetobacter sp.]
MTIKSSGLLALATWGFATFCHATPAQAQTAPSAPANSTELVEHAMRQSDEQSLLPDPHVLQRPLNSPL